MSLGILDAGFGVANQCLVARPRPRVEVVEHGIVKRARLPPSDRTLAIVLVAEGDRLGGASLLAGGDYLAVAKAAVLAVGIDHRRARPLNAVAAFLHDAAATHRHFG